MASHKTQNVSRRGNKNNIKINFSLGHKNAEENNLKKKKRIEQEVSWLPNQQPPTSVPLCGPRPH